MGRLRDAKSTNHGMNTVMTHRAFGRYAEEALKAVGSEAVRLEELLSRFIIGSEVNRVNSSAGIKCEIVSGDTYEVLSRSAEYSRYSQGLFDVTVGPLVTLWGEGKETQKAPEESRIRQVLSLVDYNDLILDPGKKTAGLRRKGQSIDLGGIGKGFAADKFLHVFKEYGIPSAFTNIGGNVVALGTKPDGSPWRVGIQHPRRENALIGLVSVVDKAVVTSGDYQRYFFGSNGKRYHHILDPTTGYPVNAGLVSVTAVAANSMAADALSTILFVAGLDKGLKFLKRFPGVEAIFVDTSLKVHITDGLQECFRAAEDISFTIINK